MSSRAKYCGDICKKAAFRERGGAQVVRLGTEGDRPEIAGTVAAISAELKRTGRFDTYLGQAAMKLAERVDNATAVMGFAALVKELRSTMDEALKGAPRAADQLDELEARRERKFAGA
jgi:hypothetical protein